MQRFLFPLVVGAFPVILSWQLVPPKRFNSRRVLVQTKENVTHHNAVIACSTLPGQRHKPSVT
jgi:hypothetical protein